MILFIVSSFFNLLKKTFIALSSSYTPLPQNDKNSLLGEMAMIIAIELQMACQQMGITKCFD
jgi:hypothetical protein